MLATLQAKAVMLLAGLVLLLVSNAGSFFYGRSLEANLQRGKQATQEVGRVSNVAEAVIQHTGVIVSSVQEDNNKEREANEKLDKANVELAKYRNENRSLIAAAGGLRIDASACAGRANLAGQAETASPSIDHGAIAGTIALPQRVDADLQRAADDADVILEKLRVLRDWAKSQDFYGPIVDPPMTEDGPDIPIR